MVCWNPIPPPTELDCPKISAFAANGWDINDPKNNASGAALYPVKHLGISTSSSNKLSGKVPLRISTRTENKTDCYMTYCKERKIVIKNTKEISLINGIIIEIQERLNIIKKYEEEAHLICFICGKYKPFSQMQADHCQPVQSINERTHSFYYGKNWNINIDNPNLKKLFFLRHEGEGEAETIYFYPNCFYGLGFRFSEDNIWPVCDTCNGLSGKGSHHPLDFLKKQTHYGDEFIAKKITKINAKGILIRVGDDNVTIAQAAIDWFYEKFRHSFLSKALFDEQLVKIANIFNEKLLEKDQINAIQFLIKIKQIVDIEDILKVTRKIDD